MAAAAVNAPPPGVPVEAVDASVTQEPAAPANSSEVFEFGGWIFEACRATHWGSEQLDDLVSERKLSAVPDMFCGDSLMRFTHAASGTLLELSAADAFRCCSWRPAPPASLQPPQVAAAARGDSSRDTAAAELRASVDEASTRAAETVGKSIDEGRGASSSDEDGPLLGAVRCQYARSWRPHTENEDVKELEIVSDWTCSTAYWGLFNCSGHAKMECDTDEQLPWELLRRRDEIMWYQELLFWEDELADNGLCRLSVNVRVMPSFWFVRMLCEVRVDNVLLREVATRLFHSFGSDSILREWTWKEATYEALHSRGVLLQDHPQISAENVGTSLLQPRDVKRQFRHKLRLGAVASPPLSAADAPSESTGSA